MIPHVHIYYLCIYISLAAGVLIKGRNVLDLSFRDGTIKIGDSPLGF